MEKDHSNWKHALFYLGLALLACHELDAVARHEWRLLHLLNLLDDHTGQIVFVAIHIPLFTALFWLTGHKSSVIRKRSQLSVDAILIVHAVLHFSVSGHDLYEFQAPIETITVYGGAIVGFTHLLVSVRQKL